eukprot:CAMPEP_0185857276 /NCGR_PEP_ID=MMETSP1354-20130828/29425_1 /TAXON_ID=708628 /ORGANISM="Erythrolobus madagascarensis, Strain CCMP3276" /LENGTH=335 /DNA_ID=CAMNT_0028559543 /DNA_START=32 /DNA_END=1035 /DNA_ORIENTATION=-
MALARMDALSRKKMLLDRHTAIASAMLDEINKRQIDWLVQIEAEMLQAAGIRRRRQTLREQRQAGLAGVDDFVGESSSNYDDAAGNVLTGSSSASTAAVAPMKAAAKPAAGEFLAMVEQCVIGGDAAAPASGRVSASSSSSLFVVPDVLRLTALYLACNFEVLSGDELEMIQAHVRATCLKSAQQSNTSTAVGVVVDCTLNAITALLSSIITTETQRAASSSSTMAAAASGAPSTSKRSMMRGLVAGAVSRGKSKLEKVKNKVGGLVAAMSSTESDVSAVCGVVESVMNKIHNAEQIRVDDDDGDANRMNGNDDGGENVKSVRKKNKNEVDYGEG